jgi:hypothetical protein
VNSVFIFCAHTSFHEEWIKEYSKIKCLSKSFSVIENQVREAVKKYDASEAIKNAQKPVLSMKEAELNIG